jgi:3'-phosphoadenosine 5'-phosphosulfate sulfotransferase (PAPS reductase)/FAD synthetase
MTDIYNLSGGMESAAMVYLCRDEIRQKQAHVAWADTGKQFPEMYDSIAQIEQVCGITITKLQPYISFDEYLFERGGMLRQGYTDCSRRMKRKALREHADSLPRPQRIALGYNADEIERAEAFSARNDKPGRTFFYPLMERNVDRAESVRVCERAGFTILLEMYRKMGRFDCFFCPNQRIAQAEKVMQHYPALWAEWKQIEKRKGHSILSISAEQIEGRAVQSDFIATLDRKAQCSCLGGSDNWDDEPPTSQEVLPLTA